MINYSEMYHILFNKITDIIEELQEIQRQTEEMYIQSQKCDMVSLKVYDSNQNKPLADKKIEKP